MNTKLSHPTLTLAAVAAFTALPMIASADTLSIAPSADGYIRDGFLVENVYDGTQANIFLVGNTSTTDELRGFLQFDLSNPLLVGATINSVTLTLTIDGADANSVEEIDTLQLFQTNTAFTEGNAQWDTPWNINGGDLDLLVASTDANAGTVALGDTVGFAGGTLDTAVFNTVGGSIGFILKTETVDADRSIFRFTSRTPIVNPASFAPVLTIDYTAVPEPSTFALLAGFAGLSLAIVRRRRK